MAGINEMIVRRYFTEVLAGDIDVADEIVAENMVFYGPNYWGEAIHGRAKFKGFVQYLRTAFPDIEFAVHEEVVAGNRIASTFTFTATHQGEWQGLAPTGRSIELPGADVFHVADGKIQEIHVFYDTLGLMQQLGEAPAPTGAGA